MADSKRPTGRRRPGKQTFTTKSGRSIKLNQSLTERIKAGREARARRRAAYLSTLPKNRFKRILFRLHPRELARYWFSRDGAIMALKITGGGIVVCFILIVGVFAYFRKDLPNIKDLSGQTLGGSMTYTDRTDTTILWQDYKEIKRQPVATGEMSKNIRNATIAIEDREFFKHGAFDIRGIIRAGVNNLLNRGGGRQGGSTISQQLVKIDRGWANERTLGNKVKEVILATEVEREYSKEDILTGYLNVVPYGPMSVGVQVAARDYFGVDAKDLTIAQSAMLAGIPKAPSTYSPYGPNFEPSLLLARQRYIIDQMANQKLITKAEATEAKAVDILAQVKPQQPSLYTGIKAPYFVLAAKAELETRFTAKTVQHGGWRVRTTLDLGLQELAEKKINDTLPMIKKNQGDTAAFVAMDNKTGQIVALVGGTDFGDDKYGKLNFGHSVRVSPGSSFKPYDYAAFIENNNAGAGSVLYDTQGPLPGWPCKDTSRPTAKGDNSQKCLWDYDFRYPGPLTLRYALAGSRNITAVKAMMSSVPNDSSPGRVASINKTIATAEAMMGNTDGYSCYPPGVDVFGATKEDETACYGSAAIGDGAYVRLDDHVNGLATLARLGQYVPRTYILKITDSSNKVVAEFKQPSAKQVIKPDTAYIVTDMLSDPNASYLSRKFHRYKGWNFAIKTGTTNYALDGLMTSWSTQYSAVTWVGKVQDRNPERPMRGAMEAMTTPITRGWMEGAHDKLGIKPVNWNRPSGIKVLPAFVVTTHVGVSSVEPSPSTDLFPSWYNPPKGSGSNQTIDVVSNKLATPCTPDLAKKTEGEGSHNTFSVDVFVKGGAGSNTDTSASDDVHLCSDSKPAVSLTAPATCKVGVECTFTITVTQGTHALSGGAYTAAPAGTASLIINDQSVDSLAIPDNSGDLWSHSFKYTPTTAGEFSVRAEAVDSVLYSGNQSTSVTFTN